MYITFGHDRKIIRCFDLDLIFKVTAGEKMLNFKPKMLKSTISSCRGSGFTPESNLTNFSSQDKFTLMPYWSLEPQEWEKPYVCYVKCIVSMATNHSIHEWLCTYKIKYISAATGPRLGGLQNFSLSTTSYVMRKTLKILQ